ncbi:unnamed protein product [Cuscuta campestris]|uniref:Uncharacterized protein n=1 Tax=Cuscuta campestris TaxID=132261 RepID=A0A484MFJ4_9ASTE|nr:unnamed protein product [Cuscuta campestris]
MEGGEKRSGSPVVADPASYKKPRRSEVVEDPSIVETEEPIVEIDKESIVKADDVSETDEEPKIHYPKPDNKEDALKIMNERLTLQLGLRWIVYRFMVLEDEKERFLSSVESLQQEFDKEKSLIDLFEGPPNFVLVAVEANALEDAKAKSGVGIREIVDRFYGFSDIYQTSKQAKIRAQLLFFKLEVLYLLNRKKIQRLATAQRCTINLFTSGYPSSAMLLGHEDVIVDVEGERQNMHNLPFTGLLHKVYIYGRKQKMMASYKDGKEIMSPDYLFLGKPYLSVKFGLDDADIFTHEEGKLINHIRGPLEAEFEVNLTERGRGFVELVIVGESAGLVTQVMDSLVLLCIRLKSEIILQKYMENVGEQKLADVLKTRQCRGNEAGGYFVGCWLTDDDESDEDEDEDAWC